MPFNQTTSSEGLKATTVNIPTTDLYNFQGTLTDTTNAGSATQGPGGGAGTGTGGSTTVSQVVMTVRQNGSTILTTQAGQQGFCLNAVQCTAADVITVTLSSSLSQDKQPNSVRLTLATSQGPI